MDATAKVQFDNIVKEFPARRKEKPVRAVDGISLEIYDGEFFALLGPSGCGKTTSLRLIAGFEQPTSGNLRIDGKAMQDTPAFKRPVNTVFQDYALFPHMNVMQNVLFGLQMEGVSKREAHQRAHEALELVRLPQTARRKPRELSGGQQQRIALARALVKRPSVLLLDEPLGALDLKLRKQMQHELKEMQDELGITFIYVTHDQEEALTMADRIAVMENGQVLQVGTAADIYETPANRFVADFIGETNFVLGELTAHTNGHSTVRLSNDLLLQVANSDKDIQPGWQVTVTIRPERIMLQPHGQSEAATNADWTQVPGEVRATNYIGTDTRYTVRIADDTELTVRVQNTAYNTALRFQPGDAVQVLWQPENARILLD